jgi:hypothetical protein
MRSQLAKRLRKSTVPDIIWDDLVDDGYVTDATDADDFSGLVDAAKRRLKIWEDGIAQSRRTTPLEPQKQSKRIERRSEVERALAFSEYLAFLADTDPNIRRFRNGVLGRRLLNSAEAKKLLNSPAARILPFSKFLDLGIPLIGHESQFGESDVDWLRSEFMIQVILDSSEGQFTETRHILYGNLTRVVGDGDDPDYWPNADLVKYCDTSGVEAGRLVLPESVLDDLRTVAKSVVGKLQGWSEGAATWFVLTGISPIVFPLQVNNTVIRATDYTQGLVTLMVEPWVSGQSVLKAYRRAQKDIIGGQQRELSGRNIAVFRFVIAEKRMKKNLSWQSLMESWNHMHQQWRYDDLRHFAQGYHRAEKKITSGTYHPYSDQHGPSERGVYRMTVPMPPGLEMLDPLNTRTQRNDEL